MVKTSESLSFMGSIRSIPREALMEQKDVLEHFFGVALSKMVIDRPFFILAENHRRKRLSI